MTTNKKPDEKKPVEGVLKHGLDLKLKAIAQINKEINEGSFDFEKETGRPARRSDFDSDLSFENAKTARRIFLKAQKPPPEEPAKVPHEKPATVEKEPAKQAVKKLKDVIL